MYFEMGIFKAFWSRKPLIFFNYELSQICCVRVLKLNVLCERQIGFSWTFISVWTLLLILKTIYVEKGMKKYFIKATGSLRIKFFFFFHNSSWNCFQDVNVLIETHLLETRAQWIPFDVRQLDCVISFLISVEKTCGWLGYHFQFQSKTWLVLSVLTYYINCSYKVNLSHGCGYFYFHKYV